jgi:two-component system sensor histidine kinase DesK
MHLLPPESKLGWTLYVWLIYLTMPFIPLAMGHGGPWVWGVTVASVLVFLPLYFRGHWLSGRRLLRLVGAIVLLAVVTSLVNSGCTVYFIYAAAFLGQAARPAVAFRWLLAIEAVLLLETAIAGLRPEGWVPAAVFTLIVGGVNIHFASQGRRDARLKLTQKEVERLAQLAERERIARDLHDLLGHTLSLITLKAELAAKLADRDPPRAAAEMREVARVSREALAEIRQAVQGYRAHELGAELAQARVALETAGVELVLETGPYELPAAVESVAALALREAVTNVVRHARASRCRVRMKQRDGWFQLEIADDGRGIRGREGAGLAGMRERVEALDGRVERENGRAGTRIAVELPLRPVGGAADRRGAPAA